ncbi:competence/damage-inducible protein A [Flavobacteriaceae bacterium AU392]|nr:competence/damage-inducible protein A [Flavobacteriaceae bacterium]RKM83737.1 competence/damage-inducible protein A [Flavobacteriaceae bacterium AU392]
MQAEIITIGDEILIGQIVDSNSAFIGRELNKIGVSVYQITSVQDDQTHILKALEEAENNVDIIIVTGGLGPTKDDITKTTLTKYFDDTLVQNEVALENIKSIWKQYKIPLTQVNIDQALIPSKAEMLLNKFGSAPGIWINKNDKVFISLPGVPFEMKALITDAVIPKLRATYKLPFIYHKTLLVYGIGESMLAEKIASWEDNLPKFIKLAYLPNLGSVRLRLSAKGLKKETVLTEIDDQLEKLTPLLEGIFFSFEESESAEVLLGQQLTQLKKTITTAESCTGGKIAERITANSGASAYFKGGLVTYATQSKIDVLKVDASLIEKHSVVSKQVAEAMALNAKALFNTDYAIATTGEAGPTKGDSNAEVGTVFIALATPENVIVKEFNLGQPRFKVINKAVNKAFEMLQKEILKN